MSALWEQARAGERMAGFEILDLHGHIGEYKFGIPDNSLAALCADMDRIGVRSIGISHMRCMAFQAEEGNAILQAARKAYPGRFIGFASFWPTTRETVRERAERWLAAGLVGQKYHNVIGHGYSHPAWHGAYEIAHRHRLPMLFHTWGGEKEFKEIAAIAREYPDASILLAHAGSTNPAAYAAMAKEHPNVYLDTAVSLTSPPRGVLEELVREAGAEKITFGSDALFLSLPHQVGKVLGSRLSDEEKQLILHDNAAGILARIRQP